MKYRDFLTDVLNESAEIARAKFGRVNPSVKSDDNNQVLTEADLAIGQYIIARIKNAFPDHNIIDEEAGIIDNNSHFTWVVDPIDGTSNFAVGLPYYGIMIGLLDDATPIASGIAHPFFDKIYLSEKGQGAWCGDERIEVTNETNLLNTLVAYGIDGHQENPELTYQEVKILGDIVLSIRNLRSTNSNYDIVNVARGAYGGSLNQTSKIWDNVAQQVVIEEAGGIYTDFHGQPMDYSNPLIQADKNFTWCAASPELHKKLQKIIQ